MIVCHCRVRNDADIAAAVAESPSCEVGEIARAAGAGDGCGSCLATIERLVAALGRPLVGAAA